MSTEHQIAFILIYSMFVVSWIRIAWLERRIDELERSSGKKFWKDVELVESWRWRYDSYKGIADDIRKGKLAFARDRKEHFAAIADDLARAEAT